MDLLKLAKERGVLIAAHRGACGGNVPCNSSAAFKAAVNAGADIIELDVDSSSDGELFIQHPGMERVHLRFADSIRNYPASVVEPEFSPVIRGSKYPFSTTFDTSPLRL